MSIDLTRYQKPVQEKLFLELGAFYNSLKTHPSDLDYGNLTIRELIDFVEKYLPKNSLRETILYEAMLYSFFKNLKIVINNSEKDFIEDNLSFSKESLEQIFLLFSSLAVESNKRENFWNSMESSSFEGYATDCSSSKVSHLIDIYSSAAAISSLGAPMKMRVRSGSSILRNLKGQVCRIMDLLYDIENFSWETRRLIIPAASIFVKLESK